MNVRKNVLSGFVCAVLLTVTSKSAHAENSEAPSKGRSDADPGPEQAGLGKRGRVILPDMIAVRSWAGLGLGATGSVDSWFTLGRFKLGDTTHTNVRFAPQVDLLVSSRISLGSALSFGVGTASATGSETTTTNVRATGRVGYVVPLLRDLDFWPRVSFGAFSSYTKSSLESWPNSHSSVTGVTFGVAAPVTLRLMKYVLASAGPTFSVSKNVGAAASPLVVDGGVSVGFQAGIGLVL